MPSASEIGLGGWLATWTGLVADQAWLWVFLRVERNLEAPCESRRRAVSKCEVEASASTRKQRAVSPLCKQGFVHLSFLQPLAYGYIRLTVPDSVPALAFAV